VELRSGTCRAFDGTNRTKTLENLDAVGDVLTAFAVSSPVRKPRQSVAAHTESWRAAQVLLANANGSHYSSCMIVCICNQVSDRDIARAVQHGCTSFDELQFELAVATSCGKCHDCARDTFYRHAAQPGASQVGLNGGARSHHDLVIAHTKAMQQHHDPMAPVVA
jgi:bacterioferritin-associated ferredoxin